MKIFALPVVLGIVLFAPSSAFGQSPIAAPPSMALERLPPAVFDVVPPSAWAQGTPGAMTVRAGQCREMPSAGLRRRIVDIAVQEWAFFGFPVMDRMNEVRVLPLRGRLGQGGVGVEVLAGIRGAPLPGAPEGARVASTIAGYWSVTPQGPGIVADQNRAWNGSAGEAARWTSPWSAAFISWVMCEAGLGTNDEFRRAVAHWTYIDQAIRARDGAAPGAAFVAHDVGEVEVHPGDLLCSGTRPAYRTLADRRRQMGVGARSHCDVVVEVDEAGERIFVIGGNVLRSVSLKVLPAPRDATGKLHPTLGRTGSLFAHLTLTEDPIEPRALRTSPTFWFLSCSEGDGLASHVGFVLAEVAVEPLGGGRC